ncbi:MAG: addiction module protein [Chloroflexi bacterium]|nr:addiction module protein [Chloroflexota bacterium]MCI0800651.1 addiction module protein [Chloroflexota bacterium]
MAEDPEEIERLWIVEAKRRAQELQENPGIGIPAEVVFKRLRSERQAIEHGLADADAKRTISNEEMARRIRSWQI